MKVFKNAGWRDRTFILLNSTFLVVFFIITLYPLIYTLSASFSDSKAVSSGEMMLFPVRPTLQAYEFIMGYREIWIGYANTLFYTIVGTTLNLAVTIPCAYALSRKDLKGRSIIMTLFVITMYFSGGLIPGYLNMRGFGLLDTRLVLLISGMVSTYNLIVSRTFFQNSLPWELHEAAFIDGCSDIKLFVKIVLPLSKPILVVMMLYYGVEHWNSYFNAMIYLRDRALYPLQVFLREILTQGQFAESAMAAGGMTAEEMQALVKATDTANLIKYAAIVVSTVPMLILYPCVQKFFEKGVMIGAVKG